MRSNIELYPRSEEGSAERLSAMRQIGVATAAVGSDDLCDPMESAGPSCFQPAVTQQTSPYDSTVEGSDCWSPWRSQRPMH